MKQQKILFYSSVKSLELFKTQKFYKIDIEILRELNYDVCITNRIVDSIKFWKYDILFSYFYRRSFFPSLIAKCFAKRVYFTGGIDDLDESFALPKSYRIQKLFFKLCYWVSSSCIVVSHSDLHNIFKFLKRKKCLSFSEHAIDTSKFISDFPKDYIFSTIAWMGSEGNVKRKGVDKALRVFSEFKKKPEYKDFKFIIMGRKGVGTAFVEALIAKYNLADSIILTGEVTEEEKISVLKRSKYYFQLSLYEGFGLAALEALCANCILIHSGKGGLANLVYSDQLLFDIDNAFENEFSALIEKTASFIPSNSTNEILLHYDIQRRKEDFKMIILDKNRNYKLN